MSLQNRKAFTMLELIFVIVVIGILSAVAIPKFALTRDSAVQSKMRTTLAAVRSSIATERQKRILRGIFGGITDLDAEPVLGRMFTTFNDPGGIPAAQRAVLQYPVQGGNGDGQWSKADAVYTANFNSGGCQFTLANNRLTLTGFTSNMTLARCQQIFEN